MNEVDISNMSEVATALENEICKSCQIHIKNLETMKNEFSKIFRSLDIYTDDSDQYNASGGDFIYDMVRYENCYFKEIEKIKDLIDQNAGMEEIKEAVKDGEWYDAMHNR